jgi:hypothetical protein
MLSQILKAGAALTVLAGGSVALAQNQTSDLSVSASNKMKIVTVKTTPEHVAFTSQSQSGKQMSPMPGTGNLAMLITGVCLAGVAARRRQVAV